MRSAAPGQVTSRAGSPARARFRPARAGAIRLPRCGFLCMRSGPLLQMTRSRDVLGPVQRNARCAGALHPGGRRCAMANALLVLAAAEEIEIGFVRPDGTRGSTPIWDVEVGDQIYVRSAGGTSGGWYRRLRANPVGEVRQGGRVYPV